MNFVVMVLCQIMDDDNVVSCFFLVEHGLNMADRVGMLGPLNTSVGLEFPVFYLHFLLLSTSPLLSSPAIYLLCYAICCMSSALLCLLNMNIALLST
jgi:hypothetical protein